MARPSDSRSEDYALRAELGRLDVAPLRLLARRLASGHQLGMHHARKKGAGLEFLGHREYTPGDDLRHLDRRALLRHGRYLIREFQVETERPLHLILDTSRSMHFGRADDGSGEAKLDRARLLAGASALLARRANDPVGLTCYGSSDFGPALFAPRQGMEQVERIFHVIEGPGPSPHAGQDKGALLLETGARLARGATVFWFSDFLDDVNELIEPLTLLASRERTLVLAQVLTPIELDFPLQGPLTLKDPETLEQVSCDGDTARALYLERLHEHLQRLTDEANARGAVVLRVRTDEDPRAALRNLTATASGRFG